MSKIFDMANEEWDKGNKSVAFKLFIKAASKGEIYAFNSIGLFYDNAIGMKKDSKKAHYWYRRGAANGDFCACFNLGICFRNDGNMRRAKFWFKKAYDLGDESAAYELGKIYAKQRRTKKSKENAVNYLTQAINSDYVFEDDKEEAKKLLKKLRE